jgi:hypothetical protein
MADEHNIARRAAERRLAAERIRDERTSGVSPWPPPGERTPDQQAEVEAYEIALAWLQEKWGTPAGAPACPYCGNHEWSVGMPVQIETRSDGAPVLSGLAPVFPVMCTNCGQTPFVSAQLPGILPQPGEDS